MKTSRTILLLAFAACIAPTAFAQTLSYPVTTPDPNGTISGFRSQARAMFIAITGLQVGIDDARVIKMEALLKTGDTTGAAAVAASDSSFLDIRIANIAKAMSNRAETAQVTLNDFATTFIGVARDNIDARQLLTGNFYYMDDAVSGHPFLYQGTGALESSMGDHFKYFEARQYSPSATIKRIDGIHHNTGTFADGDAAGVITSVEFMRNHANNGTNRRIIDYTFREFLCTELANWKDATRPDDWVGRDVDRQAGGDGTTYQTTCRACHSQLDAFRGAFAYFEFHKDIIYTPGKVVNVDTLGMHRFDRNATVYPNGHVTTDNSWANYANGFLNADRFGWRGPNAGHGQNEFAQLIANSQGFSRCMSRRFFTAMCKRAPATSEETVIRNIATQWEKTYKLKDLAGLVVNSSSCTLGGN